MIVVDVNVIAYLLIQGEKTEAARRLMERDSQWRAPDLWRHEFLNVVATFVKTGGAPPDHGKEILRSAWTTFARMGEPVEPEGVLELAHAHGISAYDAQYAWLARTAGISLVTEDAKLLKAFPGIAHNLEGYTS